MDRQCRLDRLDLIYYFEPIVSLINVILQVEVEPINVRVFKQRSLRSKVEAKLEG